MMDNSEKGFVVKNAGLGLLQFYEGMRRFFDKPFMDIRFHDKLKNLELLVGPDLSLGLDSWPSSGPPELRAVQFLQNIAGILGVNPQQLSRQLFLKQVLKSRIGTHCVFGLRRDREFLENCFVIHLDKQQRIVMFFGVYQENQWLTGSGDIEVAMPSAASMQAPDFKEKKEKSMEQLIYDVLHKSFPTQQIRFVTLGNEIWLPDWETQTYVSAIQVKIALEPPAHVAADAEDSDGAPKASNCVLYIIPSEGRVVMHSVTAHFGSNPLALGHIYSKPWSANLAGKEQDKSTQMIVLRDLENTKGSLTGRYVTVFDQLNRIWPTDRRSLLATPLPDSSHFDRVMAYYHTDLVQRYFRDLGLTVLDDYPALNPIRVTLSGALANDDHSHYASVEEQIYLARITSSNLENKWTEARDPRIVYHEFTHAVTDALARLCRGGLGSADNLRYAQILQAKALDEGLADFFACSLADRTSTTAAEFGTLQAFSDEHNQTQDVRWSLHHSLQDWDPTKSAHNLPLLPPDQDAGPSASTAEETFRKQLAAVINADTETLLNTIKFEQSGDVSNYWRFLWGHYLWGLRQDNRIGREAADMVIAHSIFFLTRWSDFRTGVIALKVADDLLFNGIHQEIILEHSGIQIQGMKSEAELRRWLEIVQTGAELNSLSQPSFLASPSLTGDAQ